MLPQLNFPAYRLDVRKRAGKLYVYDIIRRKYVHLVPEEWVRQHMVHYLHEELGYPKALIRIETGHRYHRLHKRSDVVVYDNSATAYLLIECKAPTVRLDQHVMDQLSVYNQQYRAKYLALTNGLRPYVVRMDYDSGSAAVADAFPPYQRT
jgi:hypothetical protein